MTEPLISICIPSYQKPRYVVRCLQSIIKQDYKLVEVIISDDSPGEDIKQAILPFHENLRIHYYQNQPALKTPANWNAALDKASGELMMLMHQDDWFHADDAVSQFVKAFADENIDFVFCQNTAVNESGRKMILQELPGLLNQLSKKPDHLLLSQVIGPPSNTMLKRKVDVRYDERFIWLVDVDYYNRVIKSGYKYKYIDKHLVSIGLHGDQTTEFVQKNKDIIFRETIWFGNKIGETAFSDIRIYDHYWRLLRNFEIRSVTDITKKEVKEEELLPVIKAMLNLQKKIPLSVLKVGLFSKSFMAMSYLTWKMKTR